MVIIDFGGKIKDNMPGQPLEHIATYLTMTFTWAFMIACKDSLSPCVPHLHLYLLGVYSCCDLFKVIICIIMLRNLVKRKNLMISTFEKD